MKRIQAACLFQTLLFSQKPELQLTPERATALNHAEIQAYRASLEKRRTKFQITKEEILPDGSIVLHVRKQYNSTDPREHFA